MLPTEEQILPNTDSALCKSIDHAVITHKPNHPAPELRLSHAGCTQLSDHDLITIPLFFFFVEETTMEAALELDN